MKPHSRRSLVDRLRPPVRRATFADLEALRDEVLGPSHRPIVFRSHELTHDIQIQLREKPFLYLHLCLRLVGRLRLPSIVEIGAVRGPMPHGVDDYSPACCIDGHSTYVWAASGRPVHSCDISEESRLLVTELAQRSPNVRFSQTDGVAFAGDLPRRGEAVGLLFLDAWDVGQDGFAEQHEAAYLAARPALAPTAVVAVDDTDFADLGKGRLVVPHLLEDGFRLLTTGRTTIACRLGPTG